MIKLNDFYAEKQKGKMGEETVKALLELNGFKVSDVSTNSTYFHCGDLIAEKDNKQLFVEVKTDTAAAHTGNLVIELITNKALNKDGWFRVSTADKFAFYLIETNEVILIDANELKSNYKQALIRLITTEELTPDNYYKQSVIGLLTIDKLSTLSSFRRIAI